MSRLPRFYPLTDSAAGVAQLVRAGARWVQLRIKQATPLSLQAEVRLAQSYCQHAGVSLVLNDYWQLALALGIKWVHLGQEDLAQADWPACRRHGLKLGLSTHDEIELEHALSFAPAYVAIGPIWASRLKSMAWAPQGVARIRQWRRQIGSQALVAIGGIGLDQASACWQAGADAVAVSTDISAAAEPLARARAWVQQAETWHLLRSRH